MAVLEEELKMRRTLRFEVILHFILLFSVFKIARFCSYSKQISGYTPSKPNACMSQLHVDALHEHRSGVEEIRNSA